MKNVNCDSIIDTMIKKAMLMAAGVGSRLEPLTNTVPKPLIPMMNVPMMDIIINKLNSIGINNVIANTSYLAKQIQTRYENYPNLNFDYIEETTLSGTAGGLKKCQHFFNEGENFLVLSADGISDCDFNSIIQSHINSGCIATITLKNIDIKEVFKFGVVVCDEHNRVKEFQEKPSIDEAKSTLINTGIYVFNYEIFNYIPENEFFDWAKNVFPLLMQEKIPINTCLIDCYWNDIGTIKQYIQTTKDIFNGLMNFNCNIIDFDIGKYVAGENVILPSTIQIQGNCVIGNNCTIGENVILKDSILWDNVSVGNDVTIDDCVIAKNCVINSSINKKISEENSIIENAVKI